jgi:hypothetical protein
MADDGSDRESPASSRDCSRALKNLRDAVERAITSTGQAYKYAPNSYTAEALCDVVALRSLTTPIAAASPRLASKKVK